ncbi:Programmed cell death protein [Schistosoma japonicum]|uniref:Programmed cell death protein n=1 Tax=Schistosoma japonicum TaxID=6182 RepID=A0A4Z2CM82_SCHJA|nr:Programmed cell death protein [Schistosoma japonicum]TNN05288.1 Programmed cell death protein [Schistosoma japonicum]
MALIGYISSQTPRHVLNSFDSFFGGNLITFPSVKPPSLDKIQCILCHNSMDFLMQLYCPIGDSKYHRALYIFVCLKAPCQASGNNWKVLRSQHFTEFDRNPQSKPCTHWCTEDDDDLDGESWGQDIGRNIEIHCEVENSNEQSSSCNGRFQCYSIDIYEDSTTSNFTEPGIDTANHDTDDNNQIKSDSSSMKYFLSKWSEKAVIDKEFIEEDDNACPDSFSDALLSHIVSRGEYGCEDIRYCWSGQPIFNGLPSLSTCDLTNSSICHRCGTERVFELQIFSTINNSLKLSTILNEKDFDETVNSNWLLNIVTVLIFTCRNSCWSQVTDDWIEECIIVQTDKNVTKIISPL